MVNVATLIGKNGLQAWLIQRVTAVIVGLYLFALIGFWLFNDVDFNSWQNFIQSAVGRPCALLALLAMLIHAWIGVWTVSTDYLKILSVRLLVQIISILALMSYCYWGIKIIWL
jgi:succinate dehydrogenase / fumarate reductase membrane anchor subunit